MEEQNYPQKVFKSLDEFKDRDVTLYRSNDPRNTSVYFTNDSEGSAQFEVLRFEYKFEQPELFIRFIGDIHFIEMCGGGSNSARGNMRKGSVTNVWEIWDDRRFREKISIFEHDSNMLLQFGEFGDFNFLSIVARQHVEDSYHFRDSPHGLNINTNLLDVVLKSEYLALPEDVRSVVYMYKTNTLQPTFFVVDCQKYKFSYNTHMFRKIDPSGKITKMQIKNFARMRDGGTTEITLDDNGEEHVFYSPTTLGVKPGNEKDVTFDKEVLVKVTDYERLALIKTLGILIEPEKEEK